MQINTFTIPIFDAADAQAEMNQFLRSHRVLEVQSELVTGKTGNFWCYSVSWLEGNVSSKPKASGQRKRVDYREILDDDTFRIFAVLRECRKQIAQEEGVPAYVIFTDEELSGLAKLDELTIQTMRQVSGVGEKKAERYGEKFVAFLKARTTQSEIKEQKT